jgi:hypothetical protein
VEEKPPQQKPRKVNAEKLPCAGLRLNASKPESMLESGDIAADPMLREYV